MYFLIFFSELLRVCVSTEGREDLQAEDGKLLILQYMLANDAIDSGLLYQSLIQMLETISYWDSL